TQASRRESRPAAPGQDRREVDQAEREAVDLHRHPGRGTLQIRSLSLLKRRGPQSTEVCEPQVRDGFTGAPSPFGGGAHTPEASKRGIFRHMPPIISDRCTKPSTSSPSVTLMPKYPSFSSVITRQVESKSTRVACGCSFPLASL